jgi:TRAP-type C4-dicarboxylate transport system substrate-binding protein
MSSINLRIGAVVLSGVLAATTAQARDIRVLSSFDTTQLPTYSVLQRFMDNVTEISGGETTFTVFGPEAVSIFEQLQPVSNGVFDALYTHPVFHAGDGGLALAVDAIDVDPIARRASGVWDSVDSYYQATHNLKMVGMMSVSTAGYHLFTKEPLSEDGDLAGRKVRGTPTYFGVIEALGGEPVVLPGSEIYSALQTGIVDGAGWPAAGMVSMKHFEVANYRLRPTFGTATQPVFINLDVWNTLDSETQADLLEAGRITELEMPWIGDQIQAEEDARLEELGVAVTTLSPEMAEKVQSAFMAGIWSIAVDSSGDAATALRAQAQAAGLTE